MKDEPLVRAARASRRKWRQVAYLRASSIVWLFVLYVTLRVVRRVLWTLGIRRGKGNPR